MLDCCGKSCTNDDGSCSVFPVFHGKYCVDVDGRVYINIEPGQTHVIYIGEKKDEDLEVDCDCSSCEKKLTYEGNSVNLEIKNVSSTDIRFYQDECVCCVRPVKKVAKKKKGETEVE